MLESNVRLPQFARWAWTLVLTLALALAACCGAAAVPEKAHAEGLTGGSFQTQASALTLGKRVSGYVDDGYDRVYTLRTTGGHSAYAIELVSRTSGTSVRWNLADAYGNYIDSSSTSTNRTDNVLLSANSTYTITVSHWSYCDFTLMVTEVPSRPQYKSLGNDKNSPYALSLGKAVNSQFDKRNGYQVQYYRFRTTSRHSAYAIRLFSRMDDKTVWWRLYDRYGNYIDSSSTATMRTDKILLAANQTYRLELSAWYNADSGYPSYQLMVSEVPSKPLYPSLGDNKNHPYKLTLAKGVSSQFDNPDGSQEQWFTFKTTSSKRYPYIITLTSKTHDRSVTWRLFDYYGNRVDSASTNTRRTDVLALDPNMTYRLELSGWYNGDSGFTSYQVSVLQARPGKVNGLKLKGAKKKIKVSYKAATPATGYQIAYKKANGKSWTKINTGKKSYKIKKLKSGKKYKVKVRAYYAVPGPYSWSDSTYYYGKWSSVKKVKVK